MLEKSLRFASARTRYGEMTFYRDDIYIGRALQKYGEYSELEVALWRAIVKRGDLVIDVGANIGALTLALADIVGEGDGVVYAFEPHPELFKLLQRNCGERDIQCHPLALGDSTGTTQMPALETLTAKNYGDLAIGAGADYEIAITRLDDWDVEISPSFIKIDVQGYEAEVLRGAAEIIRRTRPVIQVEIDQSGPAQETLRVLRDSGYRCYEHLPPLFNPNNFNGEAENLWPNVVSKNAVCFPKERLEDYREAIADFALRRLEAPAPKAKPWAAICRFGGIGDNLVAASICRPLKSAGYMVEVISQDPQGTAIFGGNPFIDKLSIKDSPTELPQGNQLAWNDWFRSRSGEYEIFANLSHTMEVSLALIPAQTQYWWPAEFRRKLCGHSYLEFAHDVVGMPYEVGRVFFPSEDEVEQALETKRTLPGGPAAHVIGWVLTGTRNDKIYPSSTYAVARLIRELGAHVVLMGAPAPAPDFQFAQDIVETVIQQNGSEHGVHVALSPAGIESWPIRRILTFAMTCCDLVIGPDTGPMWAVAFERMPKIMLLSHASPENITKHWVNTTTLHADPAKVPCWPCHCLHDTRDTCWWMQTRAGLKPDREKSGAACITSISVESIVEAAAHALKGE
jgi:FkbM family methyltransferase